MFLFIIIQYVSLTKAQLQYTNISIYCSDNFILLNATHRFCGWFDENRKNFADSYESARSDCPQDYELSDRINDMNETLLLINYNIKFSCDR